MSGRDLDVVVLGATGVTGRRVAAYLAERAAGTGLRWAAAARDAGRLAETLAAAGVEAPHSLVADTSDPPSLRELAARTSVVLDLVGPYTTHGRPVVEACVQERAHYADLTGEIPFVRSVIDDLHGQASDRLVKIVQVCGFEALPPDLLVALAARRAREEHGEEIVSADLEITVSGPPGLPRPSDGVSGGTVQSMVALAACEDSSLIEDPAALITDAERAAAVRERSPISLAPRRGHAARVLAPMTPAPFINPAVIQRTAALSGQAPPFRYREGIAIGGPRPLEPIAWGAAGALSATQFGLRAFARSSAGTRRRLAGPLGRILPGSGFGPAAERLEGWRWRAEVFAATASGKTVRTRVDAEGHPGYLATARMLGELGVLLSEDGQTPEAYGCLTPALALGTDRLDRFELARLRFSAGVGDGELEPA